LQEHKFEKKIMKLAVGSTNPVKINSAKGGIEKATSKTVIAEGFNVPSNVSDQPFGDEETKNGAISRALGAWNSYTEKYQENPDFSIGLEGGIVKIEDKMECCAWMVIYNGSIFGSSRTATFQLPTAIVDLVNQGMELGDADDIIFCTKNSKQNDGTAGHLTKGVINRMMYYEPAVILAFIPFNNSDLVF
jgi:inosine/xanthosine triphosphatase